MFVTQRGLLYAIPTVFFYSGNGGPGMDPIQRRKDSFRMGGIYPLRDHAPVSYPHLYCFKYSASGSVFDPPCFQIVAPQLVAAAVFPAVIFIWLTTDRMRAGSILQWHFGRTENVGELKMPFLRFWFLTSASFFRSQLL